MFVMLCELTAAICLVISGWSQASESLIELNHELNAKSLFWPSPNTYRFKLETVHAEASKDLWYLSKKFCASEHTGTHVDAPIHFSHGGWSVEQIPLEYLVRVPGVVIDIRDKVKKNSIYELSPADVIQSVDTYGPFPNKSLVLVLTGWSARYNDRVSYYGHASDESKFMFPGVSPKAVETLLGYKESSNIRIVGIGVDTGSLDYGPSKNFASHRVLSAANGYIVENMKNLEKLPARGFKVTVMPMKITSGTGGPARVFAEIEADFSGSSTHGVSIVLFLTALTAYVV